VYAALATACAVGLHRSRTSLSRARPRTLDPLTPETAPLASANHMSAGLEAADILHRHGGA